MSNAKSGSRPSRHPRPHKDTQAERTSAPAAATTSETKHTRDADLPPAAVETFAIEKDYGGVPALAALDLAVEPGESVVLIGHNGSGKTTLLRMLAGPAGALERQRRSSTASPRGRCRPAPR